MVNYFRTEAGLVPHYEKVFNGRLRSLENLWRQHCVHYTNWRLSDNKNKKKWMSHFSLKMDETLASINRLEKLLAREVTKK